MAIKQVVMSDISGAELTDETHARVVIEHPSINFPVELDISSAEADKFQTGELMLASIKVYAPNQSPRSVVLLADDIDKLFEGVKFDDVLAGARKASDTSTTTRRRSSSATPKGPRLDYTSPENAGKLHRGRVTEEEAKWVKANKDKASKNRQDQGHPAIDWTDPDEKKRYGLS